MDRTGRDVRDSLNRGIDKIENRAEHLKDNVSVAVHRGAQKVEQYATAVDHYVTVQAAKLRNDISPLLPVISYSSVGFLVGLPFSYYANCLSIKRVAAINDYQFPTHTIPVSLLRFIIDLIRLTAQSPMVNSYFSHQPNLGMAVKWGVNLALQPFSYAMNTVAVKMLAYKTPRSATEVYQQTLGMEGYGGLMHGIFSQITREIILKPLIFAGASTLFYQTLKWDESVGRVPAAVAVHAITAFLTYPFVVNKRRQQMKTHKGVCTIGQMITNEYEEFTSAMKTDVTSLWTGFGWHFLSLVPSFLLMGSAEAVAKRIVDYYYTLPTEQQYLWPRILYKVWALL